MHVLQLVPTVFNICTSNNCQFSLLQDPGKLRIQEDGVHFKSTRTGKALLVRHVDISDVEWLRVAKGFEVKLITFDGQIRKFDGFKESVSTDNILEGVRAVLIMANNFLIVVNCEYTLLELV